MKKICFITTISLTLKSFVLKTAEYLHENTDWDISFICSTDEEFEQRLPKYIHYHPVPMERGISVSGIKAMFEMKKIFKREKFDLIQYSTPNASLYASLAGFLTGVPARLYCQWGMIFVGFDGIKRKIFKAEEKFVCKLSTWIEPDSKSNLKFAHEQKLYPENKGAVIWNGSACGVNLDKFDYSKRAELREQIRTEFSIPDNSFVFGFVGRITKDKGINELLTAYREICKSNANSYLMLVGKPEIDETVDAELYSWAKDNKHILLTGYTNQVEKYLSAMDCYVLPSYREGFGMGVVEAEAMGLPVIVSNIPGPIDAMVDGETGIIVEKKDSHSLKDAMIQLMENHQMCEAFGNAGIVYAHDKFEQQQLFKYILEDRKRLVQ